MGRWWSKLFPRSHWMFPVLWEGDLYHPILSIQDLYNVLQTENFTNSEWELLLKSAALQHFRAFKQLNLTWIGSTPSKRIQRLMLRLNMQIWNGLKSSNKMKDIWLHWYLKNLFSRTKCICFMHTNFKMASSRVKWSVVTPMLFEGFFKGRWRTNWIWFLIPWTWNQS